MLDWWFRRVAVPTDSSRAIDTLPPSSDAPHQPRFRFRHASAGTRDDPTAAVLIVASWRAKLLLGVLLFFFVLFTLNVYNYVCVVRWYVAGRATDLEWVGLLYLACSVAGIVATLGIALFVLVHNARRAAEIRRGCLVADPVAVRLASDPTVVFSAEELRGLDAHYAWHVGARERYGDRTARLSAALYVPVVIMTIIDVGVLVDQTGSREPSPRVGRLSLVQVVVTLLGLTVTILPPRRLYQRAAQAYLAARYY